MSNLLIWAHQSTIDYNYSVRMELDQIVHWVVEQKLFSVAPDTKEVEKVRKELQSIRGIRLTEDRKITVTKFPDALQQTETLRDYLENTGVNGRRFHPDIEVGGDPAI